MAERDEKRGLAKEKSPYLRKHAADPLDWHPWGEAVFERAQREDKILFLSIGYRSCHWCNVMHSESFSDEEVAKVLNGRLLSVKVDREERPDVDAYYMAACRHLTGGGGWPLSAFLTPQGLPFYAATYLPPRSRAGQVGLSELVTALDEAWRDRRGAILSLAEDLNRSLVQGAIPQGGPVPSSLVDEAQRRLTEAFDGPFGGFFGAPKFPMPHLLLFLLRGPQGASDPAALTLEAMMEGAIRDHVGLGYHRYATDRGWKVPHFEKMLYDQAGMALAFLRGGLLLHREDLLDEAQAVVEGTLADLASPEGLYFAALDADSEGGEGTYYLWSEAELEPLLGDSKGAFYDAYGLAAVEGGQGKSLYRLQEGHEELLLPLRRARALRLRPFRDEKVLADWNGYFLSALARVGARTGRNDFVAAAKKGLQALRDRLLTDRGLMAHAWRDGEVLERFFLDDQAFTLWAHIELYEATGLEIYLEGALALAQATEEAFLDPCGAYRQVPLGEEGFLPPRVEGADGPYPSGNGVMALNLARLADPLDRPDLVLRARRIIEAFGRSMEGQPWGYVTLLEALDLIERRDGP